MKRAVRMLKSLRVYLENASWMLGEKSLNILLNFFVTVVIARYLGPDQFGILAYAMSMTAIFAVAGHMGLAGLAVREMVKKPEESEYILGTTWLLKQAGMLIAFAIIVVYALLYEKSNGTEFWVLLIVASSMLLQPFDVVDFWFQSKMQAKYTAMARTTALVVTSGIKVGLAFLGASLIYFAVSNVLQVLLASLLLVLFLKFKADCSLFEWKVSFSKAGQLLRQGWPIYLGAIFAVIYLKIDQIMLKWFVGADEVGVYAVAAQLSEAWYFVPIALVASLFPKLVKLHEEDRQLFSIRMQQIFDILFMIALLVAVIVTFIAEPLINVFFGEKYSASAPLLSVHIWAAIFIFMRALFSRWILIENATMFSLITQGFGALVNVFMNLLLIPKFGAMGAAWATLVSYAMASYGALFFYKKTREIFFMMTKSFFAPLRMFLPGYGKRTLNTGL